MRVAYIGNFGAPHSTENHVAQGLASLGVDIDYHQENHVTWGTLHNDVRESDFVLWTHTHDYAPPASYMAQRAFLRRCDNLVVGYHLDRWWGLAREERIREAPFFRVDLLVTADGGHEKQWHDAGIKHRWMPPAVSEFECELGQPRAEYESDLAFVGSWTGGYHPEWDHREHLIKFLESQYHQICRFWPKRNHHAIRGKDLRDLYASTSILVGDSCLAGNATRYWSDRIPETLGRGGFLLHPNVDGLTDHYTPGEHLDTWDAGNWEQLYRLIEHYLDDRPAANKIALAGRDHVLQTATYTVRMRQLLDLLAQEGML